MIILSLIKTNCKLDYMDNVNDIHNIIKHICDSLLFVGDTLGSYILKIDE